MTHLSNQPKTDVDLVVFLPRNSYDHARGCSPVVSGPAPSAGGCDGHVPDTREAPVMVLRVVVSVGRPAPWCGTGCPGSLEAFPPPVLVQHSAARAMFALLSETRDRAQVAGLLAAEGASKALVDALARPWHTLPTSRTAWRA